MINLPLKYVSIAQKTVTDDFDFLSFNNEDDYYILKLLFNPSTKFTE